MAGTSEAGPSAFHSAFHIIDYLLRPWQVQMKPAPLPCRGRVSSSQIRMQSPCSQPATEEVFPHTLTVHFLLSQSLPGVGFPHSDKAECHISATDTVPLFPGSSLAALDTVLHLCLSSYWLCRIGEKDIATDVQLSIPARWPPQPGHRALPGRVGPQHTRK